jgi:hypothetical protein
MEGVADMVQYLQNWQDGSECQAVPWMSKDVHYRQQCVMCWPSHTGQMHQARHCTGQCTQHCLWITEKFYAWTSQSITKLPSCIWHITPIKRKSFSRTFIMEAIPFCLSLHKPHITSLTQHRLVLNQLVALTCKVTNWIEVNLFCVRLNKCGLFDRALL